MNTRICRLCQKIKDESEFRLNGKYRRTECHLCELELKSLRDKTVEGRRKSADFARKWRRTPEGSAYYKKYFEDLRSSEEFREKTRKDPRIKMSAKRWRSKDGSKKLRAKYYRMKRRKDSRYRVSNGFSRSVRRGLKNGKGGVSWKIMVGYSVDQLMKHLEKQFLPGMTWKNYGRIWHIDHILPVSSFCFEKCEDDGFKRCWDLSNLRPLWARENLKKGNKFPY